MGFFFYTSGTVNCGFNSNYCGDDGYKLTDASGQATFTYSSNVSGSDTIYAYVDSDGSGAPRPPASPGPVRHGRQELDYTDDATQIVPLAPTSSSRSRPAPSDA